MTYQNRSCMPYDVQHYGCLFFAIGFLLARKFTRDFFTDSGMLALYQKDELAGILGAQCLCKAPQLICDTMVGPGLTAYQGEVQPDGSFKPTIYPATYTAAADELEIQEWFNPTTEFHHFLCVDYDPIEGGSLTKKQGHIESKRIIKVVTPSLAALNNSL